jgi:hypothetical protein
MRRFTVALLPFAVAVSAPAAHCNGWTPERRKLQTRTCIDAYWDVHPDVTPTPASNRPVEGYCACMTDEWSERVDYDDVMQGREVFAVIADICRKHIGLK